MYLGGVLCGEGGTERRRGYVEEHRPERTRGGGDDGPADIQKTKGHEHFV